MHWSATPSNGWDCPFPHILVNRGLYQAFWSLVRPLRKSFSQGRWWSASFFLQGRDCVIFSIPARPPTQDLNIEWKKTGLHVGSPGGGSRGLDLSRKPMLNGHSCFQTLIKPLPQTQKPSSDFEIWGWRLIIPRTARIQLYCIPGMGLFITELPEDWKSTRCLAIVGQWNQQFNRTFCDDGNSLYLCYPIG